MKRRIARESGMDRLVRILFLYLGFWLAYSTHGFAKTTVEIVETDPPGNVVTLGRDQNFYLHLHYESDQPVKIWVRPYFQGKEVSAGSNPSRLYPPRSGEALGWFFLFKPGEQVDEVRILAGDGSLGETPVVTTYPVQVTGSDQQNTVQIKPDWVTQLRALDASAQKENYKRLMNKPVSFGDMVLAFIFMLSTLAIGILGIITPLLGIWKWKGGWRIAAFVPAALMAFVVLRLLLDISADPTSHNLWPFEILQTGSLSLAIMVTLTLIRKITKAGNVS
ncbi:hypothetical protein OQJ13_12585 [Legionella sp. PATHC035]|uniref:hypothetical protein n=1 Tax=Legionella sp. PATHC035 TaxID=2992040 RepID=UPI0022438B18|nr:hypothetical protein [Legionella sp. PATHC035]MCW8409807.1 hypothetical protein [Legionella sp. PATHC035]